MKKSIFSLLLLFLHLSLIEAASEVKPEVVELLKPKLNSDRIAYFFGSYGVEPIQVSGQNRVSNLYSLQGDQKVLRTLAIVEFQEPVHESLKQVHQEVNQGQSIGIALRQNGWKIDKLPVYFGSVEISPQLRAWMQESACEQAAVHIYKLLAYKDQAGERLHYCTIVEVHSPQYLDEKWLEALYPDQYGHFRSDTQEVSPLLTSLRALIKGFPQP